jgi:glycosyltransferase involved in cell wall biosynthesis
VDLQVLFCSSWGLDNHCDPGFGVNFVWDTPLLEGYKSTFLRNWSHAAAPTSFLGAVNLAVSAHLSAGQYDAVWVHGWSLASHWLAFVSAKHNRIPILLRGETNCLVKPTGSKALIRKFLLRRLFRGMSRFLAIGKSNMDFYLSFGVPLEKIHMAPYTVDNRYFFEKSRDYRTRKSELRAREGISPEGPLILFSGKLISHKAPTDLLQAFAEARKVRRASLAFVGDGPLRASMVKFVQDHGLQDVHFLGFRNHSEISVCYAMSDVFVLPSHQEAWGLVVNEAMCFGLPIITSDRVGCSPDLVREGENGYTFPAGSISALTRCLLTILADSTRCRMMGEASQAIITTWGIDETAEGIVAALESVTARS